MMRILYTLTILAVLTSVSGCSDRGKLEGEWVIDEDYTFSNIKSKQQNMGDLSSQYYREQYSGYSAVKEYVGETVKFTPTEILTFDANGSGRAESYTIVDAPSKGVWRLKLKNGRIQTWTNDDGRLSIVNNRSTFDRIYFKRPNK